jgi:uncharacterized protein (TIGR02757 family)
MDNSKTNSLGDFLESNYGKYNRRKFVHPDPLEFLYDFPLIEDREIVALIASSLAYGRVNQILKSVSLIMDVLGDSPISFFKSNEIDHASNQLSTFKHRFTTGEEIVKFLRGIHNVLQAHQSLENCFYFHFNQHNNLQKGLKGFISEILKGGGLEKSSLLPDPEKGSACKRVNLFLRWMVRKDEVDPGGWDKISPSILLIPLDTHMFRIAKMVNLTSKNMSSWKTAQEITKGFAKFAPNDPVKYDFSLTRFGINPDLAHLYSNLDGHLDKS